MDDIKETLLDRAATKLAATKLRIEKEKAQKKRPKLIFRLLLITTPIMIISYLYSTNVTLKNENQVLREQSAPLYQHVNTITYPDPICSDSLIVTHSGQSICQSI